MYIKNMMTYDIVLAEDMNRRAKDIGDGKRVIREKDSRERGEDRD
jgi:hypothetical protein